MRRPLLLALFVLLTLSLAGRANAQKKPIDEVLYATIKADGVEAALDQFHTLHAQQPEAYDFGEPRLNALGYRLMGEGDLPAAIAILKLNVELNPQSLNVYDSLGEVLTAAGRRDEAVPLYRKVLALLPDADLPPPRKNLYRRNAETAIYVAEHFDAPSAEALHYVGFYGGMPHFKWDMDNLSAYKTAHPQQKISYQGFNLYQSPVPAGIAATFDPKQPADVGSAFVGGVFRRWVEDGTLADLSDLWEANDWDDAFPAPFREMASTGGKPYFVPLAFQWNPIFYRKDVFDELGLTPPQTWGELLALCDTLNASGHVPFTISVAGWPPPVARWFSILDLRLNGVDFHRQVLRGDVAFTDPRIKEVFRYWNILFQHHAFADSSASNNYPKGMQDLTDGKAVMYNLGEWIYESLPEGYDELDFFPMPPIDPDVPQAEIVDVFGAFMRAGTQHADEARQLLSYLGDASTQQRNAEALHRLQSNRGVDPALYSDMQRRAYAALEDVDAFVPLIEFSMEPALAQAALQAFVAFWQKPDEVDAILAKLEQTRLKVRAQR